MFHGSFRTFRPRHPLARVAVGVFGVFVALLLVALGVAALIALAVAGGVLLLVSAWQRRSSAPAPKDTRAATGGAAGVIEGEFKVVSTSPHEQSAAAP